MKSKKTSPSSKAKKTAKPKKKAAPKAKKKAAARKKSPTKKASKKKRPAAKKVTAAKVRKSAAFAASESKAKDYVKDPKKLTKLFKEACEKAKSIDKRQFGESWAYLQAMLRLIRAYSKGSYREVPIKSLLLIVVAIVYLVAPVDFIPDATPVIGLVDDSAVVGWDIAQVKVDLDSFMDWENDQMT